MYITNIVAIWANKPLKPEISDAVLGISKTQKTKIYYFSKKVMATFFYMRGILYLDVEKYLALIKEVIEIALE